MRQKDHRQQPKYERPNMVVSYEPPRNETEEDIAVIWQDLLGFEQIGIHDRFLDLGGNSLIGIQLVSRLRERFDVDLPSKIFFDAPTVAEMAVAVELTIIEEIEQEDTDDEITEDS
jgi:acyl carrier protein